MSLQNKVIFYSLSALLVFGGAFGVYSGIKEYKKLKTELVQETNNRRAYEDMANDVSKDNRVLRLSAIDLRQSNDKLIHSMDSLRKSLKIAPSKPGDVSASIGTTLHDTTTVIISNPTDFKLDTLIKHNDLTLNHIKIQKDSLISELTINNTMTLFVYSQREYVNEYKNGWVRFWNFDWKKENVDRYSIDNTNKLIKNGKIRVIKE